VQNKEIQNLIIVRCPMNDDFDPPIWLTVVAICLAIVGAIMMLTEG
jgi:hypothetical protein